jgi:putative membrane protein
MKKIIAASVFVLLSWPAIAQSVGERTGVNTAIGIAPKTPDFVQEAATSDMFEIESSKLANSRTSGEVKAFAGKMVTDHTQTSEELRAKAQAANVPLPTAMDNKHQKMLDKLRGLTGKDFTRQYVKDQVSGHKEAVSLFQRYSSGGDNAGLKEWATSTLPTLQTHLQMAQDLNK